MKVEQDDLANAISALRGIYGEYSKHKFIISNVGNRNQEYQILVQVIA